MKSTAVTHATKTIIAAVTAVGLICATSAEAGDVYKCQDAQGHAVYTQTPCAYQGGETFIATRQPSAPRALAPTQQSFSVMDQVRAFEMENRYKDQVRAQRQAREDAALRAAQAHFQRNADRDAIDNLAKAIRSLGPRHHR